MNKNIGFRRNIYFEWMDAAAAFSAEFHGRRRTEGEKSGVDEIRGRLDPIIAERIQSVDNRRVAIDILINIWVKSAEVYPRLHNRARSLFAESTGASQRLWLHYGMTILTYDFFRLGTVQVGQISRYHDNFTPKDVKKRMIADMGHLGALEKATERILFSLRDWGILEDAAERYTYAPLRRHFSAGSRDIEEWLLAIALTAHPAEEMPFPDLMRLPELFPFQFSITVDHLRYSDFFKVHRQGMGWDMVRVVRP